MGKLVRAEATGRFMRGRIITNEYMSLEAKNEALANQIAAMFNNSKTEVLKVNKAGVVTNFDYNNSNHKIWLDD